MKERYSYRLGLAILNPDLREERADHFETGYRRMVMARTWVKFAGFWSIVHNSAQQFFLQRNLYQMRNFGRATYRGAEFSVRSQMTTKISANVNYTYLSRRNDANPALILVDTPRHKAGASAAWRLGSRATAFADVKYEGGRWCQNDAGRVLRAGDFVLLGLSATIRLSNQMSVQSCVQNVLDRNYFLVEGYPEEGRNVFINLRYRF